MNIIRSCCCLRKGGRGRVERSQGAAAAMAPRSSITYVSREQLVGLQGPEVAVVDVRDEERAYDGHIAGSLHFCSGNFEEKLPELVEVIKGKETVVFHCAKSQVRGPTCARVLNEHLNKAASEGKLEKVPKVVVLERGFNGWAASVTYLDHLEHEHLKLPLANYFVDFGEQHGEGFTKGRRRDSFGCTEYVREGALFKLPWINFLPSTALTFFWEIYIWPCYVLEP